MIIKIETQSEISEVMPVQEEQVQVDINTTEFAQNKTEITSENIVAALGYTPASESDISESAEQTLGESKAYTDQKIQEIATPDVSGQINEHNVDTASHNDIRLLLTELISQVNSFLDVDDTTRDQLSELLRDIDANKTSIEAIASGKVNVTDIINNLTTNVANKPLSAAQGVALKGLIDTLQAAVNNIKVPTKTSELTNDSGFLTKHQSLDGYAKTADHYTKTESDNNYQPKGNYLTAIPSEYVTDTELTAKGYAKQTDVNDLSEEIADLSLGLHTDGLVYLFDKNGQPQGTGIAMIGGETGDVIGNVDSANTIVLNGNLPVGEYTVKYEMEDGSLKDIGTLTLADEPEKPKYTNLADTTSADWLANSRLGSSGVSSETSGSIVTNYISCKKGDVIRVNGLNIGYLASGSNARVQFLNSSKTIIGAVYPLDNEGAYVFDNTGGITHGHAYKWTLTVGAKGDGSTYETFADNIAYMRFCGKLENTASDVIITKNEEIA